MKRKPTYEQHRKWGDGSAAPGVDESDLAVLITEASRSSCSAQGFETVEGFVNLDGGTSPSVTLQALEVVEYVDGNGDDAERLVQRGPNIGPLSDGDPFSFSSPGGGRYFLRAHIVTGSPTSGSVHVAGGDRH